MILNKLKEIRTDNDIKQKEIAVILKVTRATYSNWENNYDIIPLKKLNIFCNYFKISLDYICDLTKNNNQNIKFINNIDKKQVGEKLRKIRKQHNDTQDYISNKIGVSRSQYADYELGKCLINIVNIIEFAKLYNISIDYLCGKSDIEKIN